MTRFSWWVAGWLTLGVPLGAGAQVPKGHGLRGAYYLEGVKSISIAAAQAG